MLRRMIPTLLFGLLLTACAPVSNNSGQTFTVAPTSTIVGDVQITHPLDGSLIYAEALYVEGTAANIPDGEFVLRVVTAFDDVLAEVPISAQDETWSVEIVHEYRGDPTEITILAVPSGDVLSRDYDLVSVAIAPLNLRPEGSYGTILSPSPENVVGGDEVEVIGSSSGIPNNLVTLTLEEPDGTVIASEEVRVTNPYLVDDVVWRIGFPLGGYTGPATFRLSYEDEGEVVELHAVDVVVSIAAG